MQPTQDNINIAFPEGFNQSKFELVLTPGVEPLPLIMPVRWQQNVALTSIALLAIAGKYDKTPKENPGIVLYNLQPDKLGIFLDTNVNDSEAHKIGAKVELNPEFMEWGINKDKRFGIAELIKLIRRQAHNFKDPKDSIAYIKSLQNFDVKFTSHKTKEDDRKGNKMEQFKTTLDFTKGAITAFIWNLSLPIFKSTPASDISIEIEIDEHNGDPVISFYSMETELLLRNLGPQMIKNEVEKLKDYFVCLEQQ